MEYHLVLQFPIKDDEEADQLITLEDDFIERLEDSADVDGHETDGGLLNLFITTGEPEDTFERIRPLLEDKRLLDHVVVAYRHVDEDDYTLIWPEEEKGQERKFKVPA
jgi:hypothetical protein